MLQTQNPYSRERIDALTSTLAGMGPRERQQYAAQHRNDPAVIAVALNVSNILNAAQRNKAMQAASTPMPKVVDQEIANMALPEDQGIGQLAAPNIARMADGGIAGYGDGDDVPRRNGMAMGGMFDFAQRSEPVVRMSGGGMAGYMPGFNKTGAVNAAFEAALQKTLGYEGGYVEDDAGKGPSNFGINKSANPDVDVKNLTKDKARELYKKRYWDAIGGDALAAKDPALATVAFDTAVNMGVSKANQLVAQSKGDPSTLLGLRQQHYDTLVKKDPEKFAPYAKGWKERVADLATSIIPSAQAGELPQQAVSPAQPEKAGLESTHAGSNVLLGTMGATQGLSALQSARDVLTAGFKPGTTAGQAGRVLGTAAAVPQAVMVGGAAATKKAMNDLQYMSEDQRRALAANPMLSAMSGDAGLAGAIMDAAANNPEGPSKMSYADQMANVGKALVQHPDIDRMREANKAKEEKAKAEKAAAPTAPTTGINTSGADLDAFYNPEGAMPDKKDVVTAAKEAAPEAKRKGFTDDDWLTLGLSLMANKSPNFMTALGEAGLQTLAGKKEREKTEREEAKLKGAEELQKAQAKYYSAYGEAIERGAKEKDDVLLAEKAITDYMESWDKAMVNKMGSIGDPAARARVEEAYRQRIYAQKGITPIMGKQSASSAAGMSPADAALVQKYLR